LLNLHNLVDTRSFLKVQEVLNDSQEDGDSASNTKLGSQMSFITEFLGLVLPGTDKDKAGTFQHKVIKNQVETYQDGERHDKIFWTDDELYQVKLNQIKLEQESREHLKDSSTQSRPITVPSLSGTRESKQIVEEVGESEPTSFSRDAVPLSPATDRQLASQLSREVVEARYSELMQDIPVRMEQAKEVIIRTIATQNMLGFTFVGAFILGAILDTVAILFLEANSLSNAVTLILNDQFTKGFLNWIWWYCFGFGGPWMFPNTFSGGDPDIQVGSAQYFSLLADFNLTLSIRTLTDKSPAEALIFSEKLRREFNTRLGPIVNKRADFKEAELVQLNFNEMMNLVNYHNQVSPDSIPPGNPASDLHLLDAELRNLWGEIRDLVLETHAEVSARRAETAAIFIFIALLNIGGMLGGVFLAQAKAKTEIDTMGTLPKPLDVSEKLTEVANWLSMDEFPSIYVKEIGGACLTLAPLGWGYSYSFSYLLFVEQYEPGCGALELDDVYVRYFKFSDFGDLFRGQPVSVQKLRWELESWQRELRLGLHCLLHTKEGGRLSDTINMFYILASARLDLST